MRSKIHLTTSRRRAAIVLALMLPVLATLPPASAQKADQKADEQDAGRQLGAMHFATSCNDIAQRRFDRAMRYQHSFWYRQSAEIFAEAFTADPHCAIAQWGIALSLLNNPHGAPPAPNLPLGLAAIEKAREIGAKTQRERDYIAALANMYVDTDKTTHPQRVQKFLAAMKQLAARYPDDDEAQIALAITLNVAASPADKTYANQLAGAAILAPIAERQPQHPGVWHYLIHLYDYPPIAQKGLDAALRYSKIAPSAPHAQHMPSHIFTRVGYWKESIESNLASVNAAKTDKEAGDQLHGTDYLVYAYLQLAQDEKARAFIAEMAQVALTSPESPGGHFALAASPARYAVERGDWKAASVLAVRPTKFAHVAAITHFARAIGAARSGNPAAGWADAGMLSELRDKLAAAKDAYWSAQVDIQWQVASAWLMLADGKTEAALALMSDAADAEDKTEKSPVTPGPLAPARELYGAMLLERGQATEALAAFEATLAKEPNRYRSIAGAAAAAEKLGDKAKAKTYFGKLVEQASASTTDRPDLALARRYMANN